MGTRLWSSSVSVVFSCVLRLFLGLEGVDSGILFSSYVGAVSCRDPVNVIFTLCLAFFCGFDGLMASLGHSIDYRWELERRRPGRPGYRNFPHGRFCGRGPNLVAEQDRAFLGNRSLSSSSGSIAVQRPPARRLTRAKRRYTRRL